jgi:citrate synthase
MCSLPASFFAASLHGGHAPAANSLRRIRNSAPQVHEKLLSFYQGFRHDAHPMAIMCSVVGALSAFYPEMAEVR